MESRIREARGLHYSFLKGNRVANLQKLRDNPRPSERNAARMWDGMSCLDLLPARYLGILAALDRFSWIANLTEQGHISVSGPLKQHKSWGGEHG